MPSIQIADLCRSFSGDDKTISSILENVNLSLAGGDLAVIAGNPDLGIRVLFDLLAGYERPNSGRVCVNDVNIFDLGDHALHRYRDQHIGIVSQSMSLLAGYNVLQNVEAPLIFDGIQPRERRRRAELALRRIHAEDLASRDPFDLSVSEKLRTALAKMLVMGQTNVLVDTPLDAFPPSQVPPAIEILIEAAQNDLIVLAAITNPAFSRYAPHAFALSLNRVENDIRYIVCKPVAG